MGTLLFFRSGFLAIHPLVPPIVGALVGSMLTAVIGGIFVQRYWVRRKSESDLIDSLGKEIDAIEKQTIEYWSLDYQGDTKKDRETADHARVVATSIRAAIRKMQSSLREYSTRYCPKTDFTPLMGEMMDACTNGEFDSAKRGPDYERYKIVINATSRVRSTLFKRRT